MYFGSWVKLPRLALLLPSGTGSGFWMFTMVPGSDPQPYVCIQYIHFFIIYSIESIQYRHI